jgi:ribosomal protein L40E
MADDLFGGLGGLIGGLAKSGLVPQDDPSVKVFTAQQELADLQAKEKDLLAEVGRMVMDRDGAATYPEQNDRLKLIRSNIAQAQAALGATQAEIKAKEEAEQAAANDRTCPQCNTVNPDGVKFCNECGTKLGALAKLFCPSCGAENAPGTKFCGSCGARLG